MVAPRKKIRSLIGRDVDIVFEHPGRQTMGASVFVAKRGGMIITCAATSGFKIEYDNRYLWMNLKTLKGCHFANYARRGKPTGSSVRHVSIRRCRRCTQWTTPAKPHIKCTETSPKQGRVLCLAPAEGLGVTDEDTRAQHLDQITLFRRYAD